jgi:KaiC/GvpD/RAD55 family RecA-like ATPase
MDDHIIVIDSYPGSGKTSLAIQNINESPEDTKIIFITIFLEEVQRIITSCPDKNFTEPEKVGDSTKLAHLKRLISEGRNIVSTHALFSHMDDELIELLRSENYTLYLDEVFQCVHRYDLSRSSVKNKKRKEQITKQDVSTLLDKNIIKIEDDFTVTWVDNDKPLSAYEHMRQLANRQLLYMVNGCLLLWSFPISVFRKGIFEKIYILTHRFESQLQWAYYTYFDVEYTKCHVIKNIESGKYELVESENDDHEIDFKNKIKEKIHIVESKKLNSIGDVYYDTRNHPYKYALSQSWFENKKNASAKARLKNHIDNFFRYETQSDSDKRLWTCFLDDEPSLRSKGASKSNWLACNARAVNAYGDRTHICYPVNRFVDPFYDDFFSKRGFTINQDEYALSEMIQFLWRSAIRNDQEITVYIPSERMRTLLKKYLNNEQICF